MLPQFTAAEIRKLPTPPLLEIAQNFCNAALQGSPSDLMIVVLEQLTFRNDLPWDSFARIFLDERIIQSTDEHIRWLAIRAIRSREPARALEPLVDSLNDPSWLVREHASLACLEAIDQMENLVRQEAPPDVLAARLRTDVLPAFLFLARSHHSEVRGAVEDALARIATRHFVPIMELTEDLWTSVRTTDEQAQSTLLKALVRAYLTGGRREFERIWRPIGWCASQRNAVLRQAAAECLVIFLPDEISTSHQQPPHVPADRVFPWVATLLTDPHPKVRAAAYPCTGNRACLHYLGRRLASLARPGVAFTLPAGWELVGLAALRRASQLHWTTDEWAREERTLWFDLALRFASHTDYRLRRAARALLGAFGQMAIPPLISLCRHELTLAAEDIRWAGTLTSLLGSLPGSLSGGLDGVAAGLRTSTIVGAVAHVGGWHCLQKMRAAPTHLPPAARAQLIHAHQEIAQRLFALRSFCVVLWRTPERESQAGNSIRSVLESLESHPCPFVATAARSGV